MTVSELIEILKSKQQDMLVAFKCFSEHVLMRPEDISESDLSEARPDGWIHSPRTDKPSAKYLVFPGN